MIGDQAPLAPTKVRGLPQLQARTARQRLLSDRQLRFAGVTRECGGGSIHHEGHEESEEDGTIQAYGHATVVRLPSSLRLSLSFVLFVTFVVMNLTSLDSSYEVALM